MTGLLVVCELEEVVLERVDVRHPAVRAQPAAVEDQDFVDGLGDLGQHVAGEQDGAPLGGEAAQQVAQPADAGRIQAVGRLVKDEHPRVAQQRRGQREALAHAERERARAAVGRLAQADELEHLVHAPG